jgi:hypothetical protein
MRQDLLYLPRCDLYLVEDQPSHPLVSAPPLGLACNEAHPHLAVEPDHWLDLRLHDESLRATLPDPVLRPLLGVWSSGELYVISRFHTFTTPSPSGDRASCSPASAYQR